MSLHPAYMHAQCPHNQAAAAGIPAIPAIPLILLDAMAALDWTVEMALVAYRSAMGSQRAPAESLVSPESPRQSQESPCEPVKSTDPKERKRLRDRINVANKRAATRAATLSRDTSDVARDSSDTIGDIAEIRATPCDSAGPLSLSLKDNPGFSRERERESKSRVESPVSREESLAKGDSRDSGLMALPSDWQPN